MTKEDIMRMAEASGVEDSLLYEHWRCNLESMTRFAALVASAERERILDICKAGLWDAEGIRYHLENQDRGQV